MRISKTFYSNCLVEALKAKIKNPNVRLMYLPFVYGGPHFMWTDGKYEYNFWMEKNRCPWYRWVLHKGHLTRQKLGFFKRFVTFAVEKTYYQDYDRWESIEREIKED